MPNAKEEAIRKLRAFCASRGETPAETFAAYDRDRSGGLDRDELNALLRDSDAVGGPLRRHLAINQIFDRLDTSHDGQLSWEEIAPLLGESTSLPTVGRKTPSAPTQKHLSDSEARAVALSIADGATWDGSDYDQASWEAVERWNLQITNENLGTTATPPQVPVESAELERDTTQHRGMSMFSALALIVGLAVVLDAADL